jgi:hypothetical protein
MPLIAKRQPDLLNDLDLLLDDLCRDWGFCNRRTAGDLVTAGKFLSATEFARAVLQAEAMNPEYEANWVRRIQERFIARYGSSVSPESYAQTKSLTD